jgi:hypothetical protein
LTPPDGDRRGAWTSTDFTAQGWRANQMYSIITPAGAVFDSPAGRCGANVEERFQAFLADGRIWCGKDDGARPRIKNFLSEVEVFPNLELEKIPRDIQEGFDWGRDDYGLFTEWFPR